MNLRRIYYSLSPANRLLLRRLYYAPADFFDWISGKRKALQPPRGLMFVGSGDFKKQGEQFLQYFIQYGKLKPEHRVLDVGCGIGRMAIPLTLYLNAQGSYEGFDVMQEGINWCSKNISTRYPHFHFTHVQLANDLYVDSEMKAEQFQFPYPDQSFDFVLLTSVFTHLLPEVTTHYFSEIGRVMKSGGRCFATFFLLDEETLALMQIKNPGISFPFDHGNYRLMDEKVQTANVAYDKSYIFSLAEKNNLKIDQSLIGFWCGRNKNESIDFQDALVLVK